MVKRIIYVLAASVINLTMLLLPPAYAESVHTVIKNVVRNESAKIINEIMRMSGEGIAIIRDVEGFSSTPYYDHDGHLTIGYGTTRGVHLGMKITQSQAEHLLRLDVAFSESVVNRLVHVKLTQGQFDAVCSLTYNIGDGAFAKSKVLEFLNQGKYEAAGNALLTYNFIRGHRSHGLDIRRSKEHKLFVTTTPQPNISQPEKPV